MANKKSKEFSFKDIVGLTDGIIKKTSIVRHNKDLVTNRSLISTGIYVLNAALSGDIYGGIPNNRITVFAGESGCGKSYLCYNIARQAQEDDYKIIYIDTEFAIEMDQLPNYGLNIDEDNFMLLQTNVIEDLKIMLTKFLDGLKEQKNEGKELPKMLLFIDSLGQLASRKEVEDAKSGKEKADMTRAKALASLFRIINADLGYLNIGLVTTNHTYESMDLFPKTILKGGKSIYYSASQIGVMTKAKLKEDTMDELDIGQTGILVTVKMIKNRMVKPKKVKFEISPTGGSNKFVGLDFWCTPENYEKVGICQGKIENGEFKPGGNRWYVRHLDSKIKKSELFTSKVFTKEVLDNLRPIIKDYFRYKTVDEIEQNQLNRLSEQIDDIDDIDEEMNIDASSLFGDDE